MTSNKGSSFSRPKGRLSVQAYLEGITAGDRVILSRAITLIESTLPQDQAIASDLVNACLPRTGRAYRLGITGVPGVGKSTFIDRFGMRLIEQNHNLAVLAIDPSSTLSRGSILGDKTRMEGLSHHKNAFIRPSPTGGSLGGVARKTREAMLLCEAAGFDVVIVETVGVGQSEVAVRSMVDFFLLLMLPNAGDDLQGIKKGIMEMADALVINKADGPYLSKARQAQAVFSQAMRLFPVGASGWKPPVQLCSALENEGLGEIWSQIMDYRVHTEENGFWNENRNRQALQWMDESIRDQLMNAFYENDEMKAAYQSMREAVLNQRIAPARAADALLKEWLDRN